MATGPSGGGAGSERAQVVRLIVGAAAFAVLLLGGVLAAAAAGLFPPQMLAGMEGDDAVPQTADPETTANGSVPITGSTCAFVSFAPGGVCSFTLSDTRGHLVQQTLDIQVPKAWLAGQADPTATDNAALVAALITTGYAPAGGSGMASMALSVDPTYAATLAGAGVTPQALLAWLYGNVPVADRPPWVR